MHAPVDIYRQKAGKVLRCDEFRVVGHTIQKLFQIPSAGLYELRTKKE